jgi:hypothetical protein
MPARSNQFQRLVAAIHEQLCAGWAISESKMFTDARTGAQREVDIVEQAIVGGYPLVISIEVRDRGRAADVTWVEGLAQKHADLPTSKLVPWSSTGFSEAALSKAQALGIEVVTPLSIDAAPWAVISRQLVGARIKLVQPHFDPSIDVRRSDGSMERWSADSLTILELRGGEPGVGLPIGFILNELATRADIRDVMLDHAPQGSGSFHAVYEPPTQCFVRRADGSVGEVSRVIIGIETRCDVAPLSVRSIVHEGEATTLAEANIASGKFRIVVREPPTGSAVVQSRLDRD